MTYAEYKKVSTMLIERLRRAELQARAPSTSSSSSSSSSESAPAPVPPTAESELDGSVQQAVLIQWYMDEIAAGQQVQSENDAELQSRLVKAVIKRMVDKDQMLMPMAVRLFQIVCNSQFTRLTFGFIWLLRSRTLITFATASDRFERKLAPLVCAS